MSRAPKKQTPPCCAVRCCYCEEAGHTHWDAAVCSRAYKGPRNRRPDKLRPVACVACGLVGVYREDLRRSGAAYVHHAVAGQALVEAGFDVDKAIATTHGHEDMHTVRLSLERARRNDPLWGAEFRNPTAKEAADAAEFDRLDRAAAARRAA